MADDQTPAGWTAGPAPDATTPSAPPGWTAGAAPTYTGTNAKNADGSPQVVDLLGGVLHGAVDALNPFPALKSIYDDANTHFHAAHQAAQEGRYGDVIRESLAGTMAGSKLITAIPQGQWQQAVKAWDEGSQGHVSEMLGHAVAAGVPFFGPPVAKAAEEIGTGDPMTMAHGVGGIVGAVAPLVGDAVKGTGVNWPALRTLNPTMADAVDFGHTENIPIDPATASGRPIVATIQKRVADSPGGAGIAERMKLAQSQALDRVGSRLAADTNATPAAGGGQVAGPAVDAVDAGQGVRDALTQKIADYHDQANTAYDQLRQIEANAPPQTRAPVVNSTQPFQSMRMAVDTRAAKAALQPIYDQLMREGQIAPLMGDQATAARVLDRFMHGPDFAPLSQVDGALSNLKTFARADNPNLRSVGQGVAAKAVGQLDQAVQSAAGQAGPDATAALKAGRAATKAKYQTADVLDTLGTEPRAVYDQLTKAKDGGIERLRSVAAIAPDLMPHVARAYLEGLMDQATAEGSFAHADALWAQWQKLGPRTKGILFPNQGQVTALDHFFLLAKKVGENVNPSGTGRIENAFQFASTVPAWGIAKLLYSKTGTQLLSQGLRIPVGAGAARTAWTARALQMIGETPAAMAAGGPPDQQQATGPP